MGSTDNDLTRLIRRVLIALVCLPCVSVAVPTRSAGPVDVTEIHTSAAKVPLARGLERYSQGDLAGADEALSESIRLDPTLVEAYLALGEIRLRQGKLDEAESLVRRAVAARPNAPNALVALGNIFQLQKKAAPAEEMYRKALAINANHVPAHLGLGELYLRLLNKPAEAVPFYRQATRINPDLAAAQFALGTAYAAAKQPDQAIAAFQVAAKLAPTDPQAHHAIGRLQVDQKRLEQAVSSFSAALSANALYTPALIDRADALAALGRNQEAAADYASAVAKQADNAQLWLKLGLANDRLQRHDEAIKAYQKAVAINPGLALAYNNLAWLTMGDQAGLDQALEWSLKATTLAPKVPQFHDTLGWIHHARGDLDLARKSLETATQLTPPQADAFYHLGIVLQEQGFRKEAQAAFRRSLQLDKGSAFATDANRRLGSLSP